MGNTCSPRCLKDSVDSPNMAKNGSKEKGEKDEAKTESSVDFERMVSVGIKDIAENIPEVTNKTSGEEKDTVTMEDFKELKIIGKGAFGEVRLCEKKSKEEKKEYFAVKVLLKKGIKKTQIPRLLAERDLMAFADHKYIVQLHYSFQDDEKLYLVMDFLQGGDLMGLLIEKDIFTVDATRFYIGELCMAVHSVHEIGYCHRDLKPDNILLTNEGHVKLADFGLAKKIVKTSKVKNPKKQKAPIGSKETKQNTLSVDSHDILKVGYKKKQTTLAHSMVGTPDYMAPEIFDNDHLGYGSECDWWGVGCIMFECLAGYAPFYTGGNCNVQDTVDYVRNFKLKLNLDRVYKTDKKAGDLVSKLICDADVRLNFSQIQQNPFYKDAENFKWDGSNKAPYHNEPLSSITDTKYFLYDSDDEDTDEDEAVKESAQITKIKDFTYYVPHNKDTADKLSDYAWVTSQSK